MFGCDFTYPRSPQARGSTASRYKQAQNQPAFPAGAGINRSAAPSFAPSGRVPRRRGDQPVYVRVFEKIRTRSPQARGSTAIRQTAQSAHRAFPAGAGINRRPPTAAGWLRCVPRRRGDQPALADLLVQLPARSPQARGSTAAPDVTRARSEAFPAGAGINRDRARCAACVHRVPRRRGDQPIRHDTQTTVGLRSPQARGSTATDRRASGYAGAFPAGAGINRNSRRFEV